MESVFERSTSAISETKLKMNKSKPTNGVDFIRELPGTEGSRV